MTHLMNYCYSFQYKYVMEIIFIAFITRTVWKKIGPRQEEKVFVTNCSSWIILIYLFTKTHSLDLILLPPLFAIVQYSRAQWMLSIVCAYQSLITFDKICVDFDQLFCCFNLFLLNKVSTINLLGAVKLNASHHKHININIQ